MYRFWISQDTMTSLFCPFQFLHPCPLPVYHIISRHYSTNKFWTFWSEVKWRESRSFVSDSLQPHGLYSPWILEWLALFLVIPFLSFSGTSICRYNPSISHENFQHWPASCYRLQSPRPKQGRDCGNPECNKCWELLSLFNMLLLDHDSYLLTFGGLHSKACGILVPCPLHWKSRVLTTGSREALWSWFFFF